MISGVDNRSGKTLPSRRGPCPVFADRCIEGAWRQDLEALHSARDGTPCRWLRRSGANACAGDSDARSESLAQRRRQRCHRDFARQTRAGAGCLPREPRATDVHRGLSCRNGRIPLRLTTTARLAQVDPHTPLSATSLHRTSCPDRPDFARGGRVRAPRVAMAEDDDSESHSVKRTCGPIFYKARVRGVQTGYHR